MKVLVTYQSKTGFTKKYAEWISEELKCDLKNIKEVKDLSNYDLIIHGGWIFGGMISGLMKILKLNPKKLIVFAVGSTPKKEVNMKQLVEINNIKDISFYYYEGGFNPKKMGFLGRTMVKMVTKEKPTYKDNTDKKAIKDLIKEVK